ncbi:hypothetical protein, partial [Fulvivirga imtechensis]|uniref:hypothetical protein n=1 Tax=Fulvivirga imtechensis TaxID=881893 RepID=UPI00059144A2
AQNGGNHQIYVYSPDQVNRIRNASNDGMALNIAMYSTQNRFVDGKGNPSNYAERTFNKKFPNSKINFPSNGNAGLFIPGRNSDILIYGLNYDTGEFDQLRMIDIRTAEDVLDEVSRILLHNLVDEVINRIFRLPPIIVPPGTFDEPFRPSAPKGS